MIIIKKFINSLLLIILFFSTETTLAAERWDLLTIESIECIKSAGGIDGAFHDIADALGAIVGGSNEVYTTGGAAVLSYKDVVKAAKKGSSDARKFLNDLDGELGNIQDDLIIQVNGRNVFPTKGKYFPIKPKQIINPDIQVSFKNKARISLIEYDSGSDNDDLGSVIIDMSKIKKTKSHKWEKLIVNAPASEDASIYYITARVDVGKGKRSTIPKWVKCGTAQCVECSKEKCAEHDSSGLDRDGDKPDLKSCPPGYRDYSYQKFPQTWPAVDVYLRICQLTKKMEWNVDLPGSDFTSFDLLQADPQLCHDRCVNNPECKAWTYVKPNTTQGGRPRCWLKDSVPVMKKNLCCVSGVKP